MREKAPVCPDCGRAAWPAQAWMHKDCQTPKKIEPGVIDLGLVANVVVIKHEKVVITGSHQESKHGKYSDTKARKAYQAAWQTKSRANARAATNQTTTT